MSALPDIADLRGSLAASEAVPVRVLDADPDLAAALPRTQRPMAARCSGAPLYSFTRGPWTFAPPPDPVGFGALVLRGLILVRITVAERAHCELLGEGDLITPWVPLGGDLAMRSTVTARVVDPVEIALLDRDFVRRTAHWPEIHAAVMHRLILRSRRLSLQSAINAIPRTQQRLELTLWLLAYRFGRVTSDGLKLRPPISHAQLAEIVAAQRPSVTIGLARLEQSGRLTRTGTHEWLLREPAPVELVPLVRQWGLPV